MSIGLYDVDFFKYNRVVFNLELMKLSSYYKSKGEIVVMPPTYSPERYTKFFLRKDEYDGTFPPKLNKYDNLDYGGLAFTKQLYVPMNEEIEARPPDTSIYEKHKDIYIKGSIKYEKFYSGLVNNTHLRLSLDGKTIWKDFEKQIPNGRKTRIIFFHDIGINKIDGIQDVVKYVLEKYSAYKNKPAILGAKFPIVCENLKDFQFWNQFRINMNSVSMEISKFLSDEDFVELISSSKKQNTSLTKYRIQLPKSEEEFKKKLIEIFKQVLYCSNQYKDILFTIESDSLLDNKWYELIILFNIYIRGCSLMEGVVPNLYGFCRKMRPREYMYPKGVMCQEEAREVFLFVKENHYELFRMFYECGKVELKGGKLLCYR